jgi:hypothetical protein
VWAGILASQVAGHWRDVLSVVAAVFVTPAIAEIAMTLSAPAPPPMATYSVNYDVAHPVLGYAPLPSISVKAIKLDAQGRTIFNVTYTIDEHGLRRTVSNPTGPTVAFFFDSTTFGEGLEDSKTLPQQFFDVTARTYHIVNLGFPGYGPQAMLRTLETGFRDELLAPRPAFFVIQTVAWQAEWVACRASFTWRTPRYALVEGSAVYQGPCANSSEAWWLRTLDNSQIYHRLIRPRLIDRQRDLDLYLAVLSDAIRIAERKYGVRVIVLYHRSNDAEFARTNYSNDAIMERFRRNGASVIDEDRVEEGETDLFIPGDGHPTPKANHLRALLIRDEIVKLEATSPDRH